MKAKTVYIKAQENADNVECLHKCIEELNNKINLLCKFIQVKHELKEEENFLQELEIEALKKDFKAPEKAVVVAKIAKKDKKQQAVVMRGIQAAQQKGKIGKNGKRAPIKMSIKPRVANLPAQTKKRARRFRKN